MSEVRWIKIIVDIFDDEKIRLIETLPDADTLIVIWFKLLALAGKCNDGGLIYLTRDIPYNPETLSTILRRPVNTVRLALGEFQRLGMIEIFNDIISIMNWEKHQNLQKLEMAKEQTRLRVQKHRESKKISCNSNVTDGCNVTVTESNADRIDIDQDKEEDQDINRKIAFEKFWKLYDKKVERAACEKKWRKVDPDAYSYIFDHVEKYVKSTPDKQFRKNPETYLNNQCWNDEIIRSQSTPAKPSIQERLKNNERLCDEV